MKTRYSFHLHDASLPVHDGEGSLFDGDEAAAAYGRWCARQIVADIIITGESVRLASAISVVHALGHEIVSIRFADVIQTAEDKAAGTRTPCIASPRPDRQVSMITQWQRRPRPC